MSNHASRNLSTAESAAIASANAPFIYFDGVPNFAFNGHVASLTLEVVRFTSVAGAANPQVDRVSVAHLRMTVEAMRSLKAALEGIELLAARTAGDGGN